MAKVFYIGRKNYSASSIGKIIMLARHKQQGFTLVTILILSSLSSILVLNSLKDNVNQERLSSNFQKNLILA